ncbi:ABC transporter substrate-binding protein [Halocella sp. SP3-1]|uniref:ABC transporter substrate-binding protein n=1 Tax=Halocella sp. SP3-1 TaxID=2382161 RepID=UPI0013DF0BC0|nr:ABC transporter substrate-binding protein [Halocella sp. SP3-1]
MRRRVGLFLIVLAFTVIFTSVVVAQDIVHLNFMHRWTRSPDNEFLAEIAKNFEKENPNIDVKVTAISNNPYKEKIKIVLGTDNAPDVFFTWPGEFTNRFIREDKVLDLTKYMEDGWQGDFVPSILEPFKYNGRIYGAPYRMDGKVFVYNKEIFKEVGVKEPENFSELIEICKKIKEAGITPIAFGNLHSWPISHYIGQLNAYHVPYDVYQKDLDPTTGTFEDPGYVEALNDYQELVPYFNSSPNAITHNQARANFLNGGAAMMYIEIIEVPEIMRAREDIVFQEKYNIFKMPFPEDGKGGPDYLVGYPEGFVVSSNTKHPVEAIKFLKYLTSKKVGKLEAKETGFINGIKNVVEKGEVNDAIYNSSKLVLNTERLVNWFDSALHSEIWAVAREELQKLTDGVTTPEKTMKKIRDKTKEVRQELN